MITKELVDFIKKSRVEGHHDVDTQTILLKNNWLASDIAEAFSQINLNDNSALNPPVIPVYPDIQSSIIKPSPVVIVPAKSHKKLFVSLVILLLCLAGGASGYYYRNNLKKLPIVKDFFPVAEVLQIVADVPVIVNPVVPSEENSVVIVDNPVKQSDLKSLVEMIKEYNLLGVVVEKIVDGNKADIVAITSNGEEVNIYSKDLGVNGYAEPNEKSIIKSPYKTDISLSPDKTFVFDTQGVSSLDMNNPGIDEYIKKYNLNVFAKIYDISNIFPTKKKIDFWQSIKTTNVSYIPGPLIDHFSRAGDYFEWANEENNEIKYLNPDYKLSYYDSRKSNYMDKYIKKKQAISKDPVMYSFISEDGKFILFINENDRLTLKSYNIETKKVEVIGPFDSNRYLYDIISVINPKSIVESRPEGTFLLKYDKGKKVSDNNILPNTIKFIGVIPSE